MELPSVHVVLYVLGTLLLLTVTNANVVVFSVYDVMVELDTFGHVTISRTNISEWSYQSSDQNNEVYLNIKELRLLDKDAQVVTSVVVSSSEVRQFRLSDFESNHYTGVGANGRGMDFYAAGAEDRALELRFYIFTESGIIHPDVAPQEVRLGDVRVNVIVYDFDVICAECSDVIKALDLVADIYGKEGEEIKTKLEDNYVDTITISKGAQLIFSDKLSLDGSWTSMPEGFPQLEAMDHSRVKATLRFPAFHERAVFGLTVKPMEIGEPAGEENNSEGTMNKRQSGANSGSRLRFSMSLVAIVLLVKSLK